MPVPSAQLIDLSYELFVFVIDWLVPVPSAQLIDLVVESFYFSGSDVIVLNFPLCKFRKFSVIR